MLIKLVKSTMPVPREFLPVQPRALFAAVAMFCLASLSMLAQADVMYQRQPDGKMRLVVIPEPPANGQYACRALIKYSKDRGEILMPANSADEASKLSVNELGDGPIKCRELKDGEKIGDSKPPGNPLDGPFSRMHMGSYFNAIYHGDRDVVRALDQQYLGKLTTDVKDAFGNNPIWQMIVSALQPDQATLLIPAIKTYAQSYGSAYKRCLRKDAVPITFVRTVSNQYGVVSNTNIVYWVNPEFAAALKETTEGPVENVGNTLGDMGYGSPFARTQSAIQEIMGSFSCDDPVITQFESQLLHMYATPMSVQ
ncbi:hypothetical protein [Eoetvoesiella caeni]